MLARAAAAVAAAAGRRAGRAGRIAEEAALPRIRPCILSGSWYPGRAAQLAAAVTAYMDEGGPPSPSRPLLALVPHAGYAYSGPTAGRVYAALRGWDYDRVLILAPSHRARLDRVSVAPYDAYATPLGEAAVDVEAARRLAAAPGWGSVEAAHAVEHAEEIQLPFLQTLWGDRLRIVPILVPPLAGARRREAAAALAPWCDGRSLLLVSTDLTHYGADYGFVPFTDRVPERLEQLDRGALDLVLARDPEGLAAYGARTGITMCGLEAAALALRAPLPPGGGEVIAYARSADRDGDFRRSVSYAGLLLTLPPDSVPRDSAAPA